MQDAPLVWLGPGGDFTQDYTPSVSAQTVGLNVLTHSRMSCAKTCLRKHHYRYELGIRRDVDARPLRMGQSVHLGLDLRAQGKSPEDAIDKALCQYDEVPAWCKTDEDVAAWLIEAETVHRLLHGYFWRYGNENYEVIATEMPFKLPITNPKTNRSSRDWFFAGKIDKIVKLADGRLAVMEHKTTGDDIGAESDYWRRLRLDQQISGYVIAARDLGYDVQTVLYDVIRKPSISPRQIPLLDDQGIKIVLDATGQRVMNKNGKPRESASSENGWVLQNRRETPAEFGDRLTTDIGERPDFYFRRQEIPRLDADLTEFRMELWQQYQQMKDMRKAGRWYRNTAACLLMGRCEYFDFCADGLYVDALPAGFIRVDDLHPELNS